MKKLLIALLLLIPVLSFGQEGWTVLLLKNGNKVEGNVVASDDYKVTIETANGQTLTYNRTEINRMDKGVPQNPDAPKSPYKDFTGVKSGFWWGAGISVGVGIPYQDPLKACAPIEADFALGYRLNEFFQVGVGFGYRYYINTINGKERYKFHDKRLYGGFRDMSLPLFGTLSGSMMPGRSRNVVPCWEVEGGYAFGEGYKVGGFFSPSIGLKFGPLERHHFVLTLGYLLQDTYILHEPVAVEVSNGSGENNNSINLPAPRPRYATAPSREPENYREAEPQDPFERGFLHGLRLRFCYEF